MKDEHISDKPLALRQRAELALKQWSENTEPVPAQQVQHLLHELQVYQIELEMQNDELRQTQRQLETAHRKYADLYDSAPVGYFTLDSSGLILEANLTGAILLGVERRLLLRTSLFRHISRETHEVYYRHRQHVFASRSQQRCEVEMVRKDGSRFPAQLDSVVVAENYGNPYECRTVITDISETKRASRELQHTQAFLQNIVDSMPSILIGVDLEGRVTEWNLGAEQATGVRTADAKGQLLDLSLAGFDCLLDKVNEAIRRRESITTERLITEQDDEIQYSEVVVYPLSVANEAIGAVIRIDNVTERVRREQLLAQTEKMLSVGGLATGVAHELNNPLGVVLQGSQNVLRRLSPDLPANQRAADAVGVNLEQVSDYLKQRSILTFLEGIDEAARRASRIINEMLAFRHCGRLEHAPTTIDDILDTAMRLAGSDYSLNKRYDFQRIEIVRDYDPELGPIECNQTAIEQVFLNLLKNAAQAMAGAGTHLPRRITLRTRRPGNEMHVEVEDNGPGMDEKTASRVFEPFFTTKPVGVGTGLGLSMSYFIITFQHGGKISVSSMPGKGTRFRICLPLQRTPAFAEGT